ncbi:hypothetical protein [Nocardia arthritidis]|uniref:Uncharacterized protein n=1 Tax=Nocardia arthritidis TaxID=228602 RepID=A0A6G9YQR9_9NOCA|nr:hypothetical protein [Nocardia arthritidis]QIS15649.1 hypothetical protein F5544_39140 [Nocardia arthritidis]
MSADQHPDPVARAGSGNDVPAANFEMDPLAAAHPLPRADAGGRQDQDFRVIDLTEDFVRDYGLA